MDKMDREILRLLQEDGRMTVSDLSKALSLSRPSMSERLHRLRERGVIEKFSARVSLDKIGKAMLVVIQVGGLKVSLQAFEEVIQTEEAVIECHRVTGEVSYFLKAAVANVHELRELIDRLVPFGTINTSTVLHSPVHERMLLPEV
ncbi:Lrp/AsnC family transcriptional regulator [Bacillus sp. FSL W7-1360]